MKHGVVGALKFLDQKSSVSLVWFFIDAHQARQVAMIDKGLHWPSFYEFFNDLYSMM